jgi:RNA polymerase sigma-70 factor (ECF subfamily)
MADPDDFVPFYRREAETVLSFLTRRTLDADVAVDLTAETFAQAWRAWPRVRSDSREEMRALLHTIARGQPCPGSREWHSAGLHPARPRATARATCLTVAHVQEATSNRHY